MTIQPLPDKSTDSVLSSKSTQNNKLDKLDVQVSDKPQDSVDITAVAKEITKAFESSKSTPAINEDRVNAVKKALEEGNYPIDPEQIAKKMIQLEREQFYNSR